MHRSFTRRSRTLLVVLIAVSAAFVGLVLAITVSRGKPADYVFKDLAYLAGRGDTLGGLAAAVSNAGILLWAGGAAMALLTSVALLRAERSSRVGRFLLVLGAVTAVAAVDDFFMLHDAVLPYLGVPQKVYPVAYALTVGATLWFFRDVWPRWTASFLVVSVGLLALSAGADLVADVLHLEQAVETAVEDSLKFFGIVLWTAYVARYSSHWLAPSSVASRPADREYVDA